MIITDEPGEKLEIKFEDDRFALVHRIGDIDGWTTKVTILNKREALLIHQAIGDFILGKGDLFL